MGRSKESRQSGESLWRVITIPEEIVLFLLKRNQFYFGQSEHESTPFTTETMQQKFNWNKSTEKAGEVIKGIYNSNKYVELIEIMKLVLTNVFKYHHQKKPIQKLQ